MDFSELRGLHLAARAVEVALAGSHSLLIIGGAGFGKSALVDAVEDMTKEKVITLDDVMLHPDHRCDFPIVATSRPCICGNYTVASRECVCSASAIREKLAYFKYRYDMFTKLEEPSFDALMDTRPSESSEVIMDRVRKAREFLHKVAPGRLDKPSIGLLRSAHAHLLMSPGMVFRVINVSRTIAALGESNEIAAQHIAEAIQYRGPEWLMKL